MNLTSTKSEPNTGIVIASHGALAHVECDGTTVLCKVRKKVGAVACGDRVSWVSEEDGGGIIIAIAPRRNTLCRQIDSKKSKILAANIDQLLVTLEAPSQPATDPWNMLDTLNLDRYIVAAEIARIMPAIVINKIDRLNSEQNASMQICLDLYRSLTYDVLTTSMRTQAGLDALRTQIRTRTSVIVGRSGVGKSSLANALIPGLDTKTGTLSAVTGLGRHTTTVATLYPITGGGALVDSPGVREFQLSPCQPADIAWGFREFRPFFGHCRFNDCKHGDEPDCAIVEGTKTGAIHSNRYRNFQRIVQDTLQPIEGQRAKAAAARRRHRSDE